MKLILGNCIDVLKTYPDNTFDSAVTDPPYSLEFMGRGWDSFETSQHFEDWVREWASQVLRVLKPGGHLLAFGGSRTYHRLACGVEDAGFEIRDQIMWLYGSGFPKSLDVSKAIDKAAGAQRKVVGTKLGKPGYSLKANDTEDHNRGAYGKYTDADSECAITAPATSAAKRFSGFGTALKPAHEPIVVARKPLIGTVAQNVLKHGTGGVNIDGCRVATNDKLGGGGEKAETSGKFTNEGWRRPWMDDDKAKEVFAAKVRANVRNAEALGRFPANVIHDGSDEVLEEFAAFGERNGGHHPASRGKGRISTSGHRGQTHLVEHHAETGTAARFFYCAKAGKKERGEGNDWPTVKPLLLMRYLCRLVTPPNGIVLDPFMGSGSTIVAAILEGFKFEGIDADKHAVSIARARVAKIRRKD